MVIAKPVMRGFTAINFKRDMIITAILATTASVAFHYSVAVPRRKAYAEFYKTYDIEADFHRMRNLGLFNSCQPDDV